MSAQLTGDGGAGLLSRIIQPAQGNLSEAAARSILEFRLPKTDRDRVNMLAAKARAGELTIDERQELDEYERVTCLIELLQSKARLSLECEGAA